MSLQPTQENAESIISDINVAEYLVNNPGFFNAHAHLLPDLELSHKAGGAISLIERQVSLLRDQNSKYKKQLAELIGIARENDQLIAKLQALTLSMLDATDLNEIFVILHDNLKHEFNADFITLSIFAEPNKIIVDHKKTASLDVMFIDHYDDNFASLNAMIEKESPVCGPLDAEQCEFLFAGNASDVGSAALIPLITHESFSTKQKALGLLSIGSLSENRYQAGISTQYLRYLGEIVTRVLRKHFVEL